MDRFKAFVREYWGIMLGFVALNCLCGLVGVGGLMLFSSTLDQVSQDGVAADSAEGAAIFLLKESAPPDLNPASVHHIMTVGVGELDAVLLGFTLSAEPDTRQSTLILLDSASGVYEVAPFEPTSQTADETISAVVAYTPSAADSDAMVAVYGQVFDSAVASLTLVWNDGTEMDQAPHLDQFLWFESGQMNGEPRSPISIDTYDENGELIGTLELGS